MRNDMEAQRSRVNNTVDDDSGLLLGCCAQEAS